MKNNPYVGKIQNSGSQIVKGNPQTKAGNGQVKTGTDLRTGSGKK